jgi:hypothetical protein
MSDPAHRFCSADRRLPSVVKPRRTALDDALKMALQIADKSQLPMGGEANVATMTMRPISPTSMTP